MGMPNIKTFKLLGVRAQRSNLQPLDMEKQACGPVGKQTLQKEKAAAQSQLNSPLEHGGLPRSGTLMRASFRL